MSDPLEAVFDEFANATEAAILQFAAEIKALKQSLADLVTAEVQRAVAALPAPKNGEDGKSVDPQQVALWIDAAVSRSVAALPKPENGQDGKNVEMSDVADLVARAVAETPKPKDGTDGKSVDPAEVVRLVTAEVEKAVALIPVPRDGKDGAKGRDADVEAIAAIAAIEARKAVAALPIPRDGRDGKGEKGDPGTPGKDGITLEQFHAALKEAQERTRAETVAAMIEGIEFDGRTWKLFGDREIKTPSPEYYGVWKDGEYQRGDAVTWAGSYWVCMAAKTVEKPGDGSKDWVLAVKRGRDGKDAGKA